MPAETEAKYAVRTFAAVRKQLARLKAKPAGMVVETDAYFDTPDHALRSSGKGLRIRRTRVVGRPRGADARPLVTMKRPVEGQSRVKIREELQTHVEDPAPMQAIFEELGAAATLTIQKRREPFQLGKVLVTLDELPIIGRFVEIEAPSERQVCQTASRLGLPDEPINEHYITLLRQADPRIGESIHEVRFTRRQRPPSGSSGG